MNEEQEHNAYRFSGILPPLVKLDLTGLAYWVEPIHEPYNGTPAVWTPAPANRKIKPYSQDLINQDSILVDKPEYTKVQIEQIKKENGLFTGIKFKRGK